MLILTHTCYYVSPKGALRSAERQVKYYELELYTRGDGFSVLNGKKYPHSPGVVLVALPGDKRYSIGSFECHSFKFMPDNDNSFAICVKRLCGVHSLPNYAPLIPFFEEIYAQAHKSGGELHIDAAIRGTVSYLYKDLSLDGESVPVADEAVQRVLAYISENPDKQLSLLQLADIARQSPSHFHKNFKASLSGMTPGEYILKKRIEYAKGLLCDNSLSVERVAEMSGFSTRAYFDVCFKKETGKTPAFFRRELNSGMI